MSLLHPLGFCPLAFELLAAGSSWNLEVNAFRLRIPSGHLLSHRGWPKLPFPKWRTCSRDKCQNLHHKIGTRITTNLGKYPHHSSSQSFLKDLSTFAWPQCDLAAKGAHRNVLLGCSVTSWGQQSSSWAMLL